MKHYRYMLDDADWSFARGMWMNEWFCIQVTPSAPWVSANPEHWDEIIEDEETCKRTNVAKGD